MCKCSIFSNRSNVNVPFFLHAMPLDWKEGRKQRTYHSVTISQLIIPNTQRIQPLMYNKTAIIQCHVHCQTRSIKVKFDQCSEEAYF